MRLEVGSYLVAEVTRLGDGAYLAALADFSAANDAERFYEAPAPLMLLDADGEPRDSLRDVRGVDMMVTRSRSASGRPLTLIAPVPMARESFYATASDRIYTGWNGAFEIVVRSLSGGPIAVIRAPGLELPMDDAEVSALYARRLGNCRNEQCERNIEAMFEDRRFPERRPAFSELKVDALDHLWVAEYEPTGAPPAGWHVFSPDGELLGHVTMPAGLEVHEIGTDHVLGVEENELDVPFVRRFPLRRLR